jgi:hypothetical protein
MPFHLLPIRIPTKMLPNKKKKTRLISSDSAFCDEISQLGEFVFQKMKKTHQNCDH